MDLISILLVLVIIKIIAFLYSSVGHGGASGYLAIMVILGFAPDVLRPTALTLNIIVSSIATIQFYRSGYFRKNVFLPFIYTSVPMAFIGSKVSLPDPVYKIILGICLLIAVARIIGLPGKNQNPETRKTPFLPALFIGSGIGFISGMIGIGGGIILSPILLLFRWANVKQTAAVTAPFIFLNSIAGISGLLVSSSINLHPQLGWWIGAASLGGLAGSYLGSKKFNTNALRYLLATVLVIAAGKLFIN